MNSQVQLSTREATLSLLLKQGELSATNLASFLGVSVQAMRRHLRSLEDDGLVESIPISLGPGRPSNQWHLTIAGQNRFNSGEGSERFALELLGSIEATFSAQSLSKVLAHQALEKANLYKEKIGSGKIEVRLEKLVELRNQEGHGSEYFEANEPGGDCWYLHAFHCSIRGIAEQFPGVCDQELQLISYIFPECTVERVQWRVETGKSCGFKIKVKPSNYKS